MFTGIIQELGTVGTALRTGAGITLGIRAPSLAKCLKPGESIAVDGACQTVVTRRGEAFFTEAVEETLRKTTLGDYRPGRRVNLELPLGAQDRFGGHIVQGHVDCTGTVKSVARGAGGWLISIAFPTGFRRNLVSVGSIAVDGVSLTVASVSRDAFTVSVIPHTRRMTTLGLFRAGRRINLEFDLVGKYVESMLRSGGEPRPEALNAGRLRDWGYGA
ncbi:MAG: riboflavin synthase [Bacteroidota bacterium]